MSETPDGQRLTAAPARAGETGVSLPQANADNLQLYLDILRQGRDHQRRLGFVQWSDTFPDPQVIARDIERGVAREVRWGGEVAGYLVLDFAGEQAYENLQGKWLLPEPFSAHPYATMHRVALASAYRGQGLASRVFAELERQALQGGAQSLRGDTHRDNKGMQYLFDKHGYTHCGTVTYPFGQRLAYEKLLQPNHL